MFRDINSDVVRVPIFEHLEPRLLLDGGPLGWSASGPEQDMVISGDFWYGEMGVELGTPNVPVAEAGTMTCDGTTLTLTFDSSDSGPSVETQTVSRSWYDSYGQLQILFNQGTPDEFQVGGSGNDDTFHFVEGDLEDDAVREKFFLRKASGFTDANIIGEYAEFGVWYEVDGSGATSEYGDFEFRADYSFVLSGTESGGAPYVETGTWSFNPTTSEVTVLFSDGDSGIIGVGQNGCMVYWDINALDDSEIGYAVLVKKSSGHSTADDQGYFLNSELLVYETDIEPELNWGRVKAYGDGTLEVETTGDRVNFEDLSGTYTVADDGEFGASLMIDGSPRTFEGHMSPNGNLIVIAQLGYDGRVGMTYTIRPAWDEYPPGDSNGDGRVDGWDLAQWQRNYDPVGLNDNNWTKGDWNDDDKIDGADLALWQRNYNPVGTPGDAAITTGLGETVVELAEDATTVDVEVTSIGRHAEGEKGRKFTVINLLAAAEITNPTDDIVLGSMVVKARNRGGSLLRADSLDLLELTQALGI